MCNTGVFIIKNSENGINFLKELIYNFENSKCISNKNKLNGIYGLLCYEQGSLNKLIYEKYQKYTTFLPDYIISNVMECDDNKGFILHNYGGNHGSISSCFKIINSKL
jgi:hypothetical protein